MMNLRGVGRALQRVLPTVRKADTPTPPTPTRPSVADAARQREHAEARRKRETASAVIAQAIKENGAYFPSDYRQRRWSLW
jgi:hypothetical protein